MLSDAKRHCDDHRDDTELPEAELLQLDQGSVQDRPEDSDSDSNEDITDSSRMDESEDPSHLEQFIKEWSVSLDRDDKIVVSLCIQHVLTKFGGLAKTRSDEVAGNLLGYSERHIRR